MRAPAAKMMHWNDYSIVTMARTRSETISPIIQSSRMILVRARHQEFQRSHRKMRTAVNLAKLISARVTISQFITRSFRHQHHRLHQSHHRQVKVKITISTRTILHMHIQIHTNLAKYELKLTKKDEILPILLLYSSNL